MRQFCKSLADTAVWVAVVANDWPAPIAHEYYRLRELLADGQLVSALWQLKDVAEILIKFPAIVMAQAVFSAAGLPSPSGRGAGGEGAVAQFFRVTPKKTTTMYQLLLELNNWRNEQLGHGALRLNVSEFQEDLERYVAELNQQLQKHQGMWRGMSL